MREIFPFRPATLLVLTASDCNWYSGMRDNILKFNRVKLDGSVERLDLLYFVAFASYLTTDFWSDLSMWGI